MDLSLNNYKKVLPEAVQKKAATNIVRECDEIEKNCFQAYVDEKDASFDVSVSLNDNKEITAHSCDCHSKVDFCQHKTALLLHLIKNKPENQPVKGSRKAKLIGTLLEGIDPAQLKSWVKEVLAKNKDLELAFIHQFSSRQTKHTPADIKQLTKDAVKAVIKGRKRAEANEVKRIVELWTEMHDALVNEYCSDLTGSEAFGNFNSLVEAVEETQAAIATNSTRFNKYLENQLLKVVAPLHQLQADGDWNIATGYFADRLEGERLNIRTNYLLFLVNVLDNSSPVRKTALAGKLAKQYVKCNTSRFYNGSIYTEAILRLVAGNDLFETYYQVFKPIRFNNDYNEELIGLLIEYGHLELAEKYCQEQIERNFREEYDTLYLEFLKEIYTTKKDDKKLAEVLKPLFPLTFNFDEYLFICEHTENEEERKKWRTKVLVRARQMPPSYKEALVFPFKLMDHEQKYKKMIEYIDPSTPYNIIARYAERMIDADRTAFLKAVFYKFDDTDDMDEASIVDDLAALAGILKARYDAIEIQRVMNSVQTMGAFYQENMLLSYFKKAGAAYFGK